MDKQSMPRVLLGPRACNLFKDVKEYNLHKRGSDNCATNKHVIVVKGNGKAARKACDKHNTACTAATCKMCEEWRTRAHEATNAASAATQELLSTVEKHADETRALRRELRRLGMCDGATTVASSASTTDDSTDDDDGDGGGESNSNTETNATNTITHNNNNSNNNNETSTSLIHFAQLKHQYADVVQRLRNQLSSTEKRLELAEQSRDAANAHAAAQQASARAAIARAAEAESRAINAQAEAAQHMEAAKKKKLDAEASIASSELKATEATARLDESRITQNALRAAASEAAAECTQLRQSLVEMERTAHVAGASVQSLEKQIAKWKSWSLRKRQQVSKAKLDANVRYFALTWHARAAACTKARLEGSTRKALEDTEEAKHLASSAEERCSNLAVRNAALEEALAASQDARRSSEIALSEASSSLEKEHDTLSAQKLAANAAAAAAAAREKALRSELNEAEKRIEDAEQKLGEASACASAAHDEVSSMRLRTEAQDSEAEVLRARLHAASQAARLAEDEAAAGRREDAERRENAEAAAFSATRALQRAQQESAAVECELEAERASFQAAAAASVEELSQAHARIRQLDADVAKLTTDASTAHEAASANAAQNAQLTSQVAQLTTEAAAAREDASTSASTVAQRVASAREAVEHAVAAEVAAFQGSVSAGESNVQHAIDQATTELRATVDAEIAIMQEMVSRREGEMADLVSEAQKAGEAAVMDARHSREKLANVLAELECVQKDAAEERRLRERAETSAADAGIRNSSLESKLKDAMEAEGRVRALLQATEQDRDVALDEANALQEEELPNEHLRRDYIKLLNDHKRLREDWDTQRNATNSASTRLDEIYTKWASALEENNALSREVADLTEKLAQVEQACATSDAESTSRREKLATAEEMLTSTTASLDAVKERAENAESSLREAEERVTNLAEKLTTATELLATAEQARAYVQAELDAAKEVRTSMEARLEANSLERSEWAAVSAELAVMRPQLARSSAELATRENELDAARKERDAAVESQGKADRTAASLRDELDTLERARASLSEELCALRKDHEATASKLERMQSDAPRAAALMHDMHSNVKNLSNDLARLKEDASASAGEALAALTEDFAPSILAALQSAANGPPADTTLAAQAQSLELIASELRLKVSEGRAEREVLRSQISDLSEDAGASARRLAYAEWQVEEHAAQLTMSRAECTRLSEELLELEKLRDTSAQLSASRAETERLSETLAVTEHALAEAKQELTKARDLAKATTPRRTILAREKEKMKGELASASSSLADLKEKYANLERDHAKLVAAYAALRDAARNTRERSENALHEARAELEASRKELNRLQQPSVVAEATTPQLAPMPNSEHEEKEAVRLATEDLPQQATALREDLTSMTTRRTPSLGPLATTGTTTATAELLPHHASSSRALPAETPHRRSRLAVLEDVKDLAEAAVAAAAAFSSPSIPATESIETPQSSKLKASASTPMGISWTPAPASFPAMTPMGVSWAVPVEQFQEEEEEEENSLAMDDSPSPRSNPFATWQTSLSFSSPREARRVKRRVAAKTTPMSVTREGRETAELMNESTSPISPIAALVDTSTSPMILPDRTDTATGADVAQFVASATSPMVTRGTDFATETETVHTRAASTSPMVGRGVDTSAETVSAEVRAASTSPMVGGVVGTSAETVIAEVRAASTSPMTVHAVDTSAETVSAEVRAVSTSPMTHYMPDLSLAKMDHGNASPKLTEASEEAIFKHEAVSEVMLNVERGHINTRQMPPRTLEENGGDTANHTAELGTFTDFGGVFVLHPTNFSQPFALNYDAPSPTDTATTAAGEDLTPGTMVALLEVSGVPSPAVTSEDAIDAEDANDADADVHEAASAAPRSLMFDPLADSIPSRRRVHRGIDEEQYEDEDEDEDQDQDQDLDQDEDQDEDQDQVAVTPEMTHKELTKPDSVAVPTSARAEAVRRLARPALQAALARAPVPGGEPIPSVPRAGAVSVYESTHKAAPITDDTPTRRMFLRGGLDHSPMEAALDENGDVADEKKTPPAAEAPSSSEPTRILPSGLKRSRSDEERAAVARLHAVRWVDLEAADSSAQRRPDGRRASPRRRSASARRRATGKQSPWKHPEHLDLEKIFVPLPVMADKKSEPTMPAPTRSVPAKTAGGTPSSRGQPLTRVAENTNATTTMLR